jgi:hypothetical protein
VAPPCLGDAVRFPYGAFRFRTPLPKGTEYVILASSDLKIWSGISEGTAGLDPIEYLDSEAFKFSSRFYRVMAGEVCSRNVIGYVSFVLPPGFSMIANPLDGPSKRVSDLFKGWPDGTRLSKYDTREFCLEENVVKNGKWTNSSEKLMPGEGAIFFNPTSDYKSHSFVGEVLQGNLSVPIPPGFSIRSSLLPYQGSLDELNFPIADGDVIHLFDRDRQQYALHPYENGKWTSGAPMMGLGESFWVAKAKPGNWVRKLSIEN